MFSISCSSCFTVRACGGDLNERRFLVRTSLKYAKNLISILLQLLHDARLRGGGAGRGAGAW